MQHLVGALVQADSADEFQVIGAPGKQALHANSIDRRMGSNSSTLRMEPGKKPGRLPAEGDGERSVTDSPRMASITASYKRGIGFPENNPNGSVCWFTVAMVASPAYTNGHLLVLETSTGWFSSTRIGGYARNTFDWPSQCSVGQSNSRRIAQSPPLSRRLANTAPANHTAPITAPLPLGLLGRLDPNFLRLLPRLPSRPMNVEVFMEMQIAFTGFDLSAVRGTGSGI